MCDNTYGDMASCIMQIRKLVPEAALYEQLAEECNELSQACLKKARKLRNENYTPKTMEEIDENLEEEYTDVQLSAYACGLIINWAIEREKAVRWIKRNEMIENSKV